MILKTSTRMGTRGNRERTPSEKSKDEENAKLNPKKPKERKPKRELENIR